MTNQKRPVYLVVKPLGIMVQEEGEEVEATILIAIKQTRLGAEQELAKNPGARIDKGFVSR